jgi:phospholipid/cholesterol/gamma-HCH transport system ATP-binding protein
MICDGNWRTYFCFAKDGLRQEGTKEEIFRTDNQSVIDFVYSSNLFRG